MPIPRLVGRPGYLVIVIYMIMCLLVLPLTAAAPLHHPPGVRFPEQKTVPPELLKDGQSQWDKAFVMKMINVFESQTSSRLGLSSIRRYTRDYVFEGDIVLDRSQALGLITTGQTSRRLKRKVDVSALLKTSSAKSKRWSLPINYIFHKDISDKTKASVQEGVRHWEDNTCIRFTNEANSSAKTIVFINDHMCYSYVGNNKNRRQQIISIGDSCSRKGIVAHEIGHALGFWHEHARNDREKHVEILWKNIEIGQSHNFANQSWGVINNLEIPYDVGSVMHYSGKTFAVGSAATIKSHNPLLQNSMGQRQKLSFYDVKIANMAYCNESCQSTPLNVTCLHDGYQDPNNCTRCRCPDGLSGDICDRVAPSSGDCGGTIHLSEDSLVTISSPGYPESFTKDQQCYWLIKSPNGTSIRLKFAVPYMHSRYCDSDHPYLQCEDFVEVRTADNLALTGGRFCCNDSLQTAKIQEPIVSHTNHAMVIFKTQVDGFVGFSLNVSIESCGGCYNTWNSVQPRCTRKVVRDCTQTWYVKKKESGCVVPSFWKCLVRYRIVPVYRPSKCYGEETYCCEGYTLSTDGQTCEQNQTTISTSTSKYLTNTTVRNNTSTTETTVVEMSSTDKVTLAKDNYTTLSTAKMLNVTTTPEDTITSTTSTNNTILKLTTVEYTVSESLNNASSVSTSSNQMFTNKTIALTSSNLLLNYTTSAAATTSSATSTVSSSAKTLMHVTSSKTSSNEVLTNISDEEDEGIPNTWSQWDGWGACSVTCGGCGVRTRSRTCENGEECSGNAVDSEPCGENICDSTMAVQTCSTTTVQRFGCGFFGLSSCYRTVVQYKTQTFACCCGYSVQDDICVNTQE